MTWIRITLVESMGLRDFLPNPLILNNGDKRKFWQKLQIAAHLSHSVAGFVGAAAASSDGIFNSVLGTPISHLSNHATMWSRRSTRCHGCPDRESSCDSPGK